MTYRVRNLVIAIGLALVAVLLTLMYVTNYKRSVQHQGALVRVYVAARGEPLVARMARVADETGARALAGVAARERAMLMRVLGKLADNLSGGT